MLVVMQGLRVSTRCRYIKFTESTAIDVYEDALNSCIHIEFPKGINSKFLVDRRIEVLEPQGLVETDYIKLSNPTVTLNGLKLTRTVQHDYTLSQLIVEDIDKFIMQLDEYHCDILIPKRREFDRKSYLELLGKNPYIQILDASGLEQLRNVYLFNIGSLDVSYVSGNDYVFSSAARYERYLLPAIESQKAFLDGLRSRLMEFGVELRSFPVDHELNTVHKVTYRLTEVGRQLFRKTNCPPLDHATLHHTQVDLALSTPDISLLSDFKTRYQNLDLLTDYTEFHTLDAHGNDWVGSVEWTPLDTSFDQNYSQDENGNISFECRFGAGLEYYVVYDRMYRDVESVVLRLLGQIGEDGTPSVAGITTQ